MPNHALRRFAVFTAILVLSFPAAAQEIDLDPGDINVASGYRIEPVVSNLSVPTTLVFDGNDMLVAESGFANTAKARVLRIKPDGTVTIVAEEGLISPVTGLLVVDGRVYVSHRTKVSIVQTDGTLKDIVTDLPSRGDHQNNQIVLGPDGKIYMGQGTVTNSGVVGEDNFIFGWLKDNPQLREVPCKDIVLSGQNFETANPLTEDNGDRAFTGAYKPFGVTSTPGEIIRGNRKCGGSIVRFDRDGSNFELVAWGLRNPFGLEFDRNGRLWSTFHGADVRGSRNIYNDPDYLVQVKEGAWYGWPEFFNGEAATSPRFRAPLKASPTMLWATHPTLTTASTTFETHSAVNGIAFSRSSEFGFVGDLFVAMFGTFAPVTTGVNVRPAGFRVARVDMETGDVEDFAGNEIAGPAYLNGGDGFNRPSDVTFGPDNALYVLDWGGSRVTGQGLEEVPGSGAIWRIYPERLQPIRPNGPIVVEADPSPESEREPIVPNIPETYQMIAPELLLVGAILVLLIIVVVSIWYALRRTSRKK